MPPSRLGRALYAGVLAYTAVENFQELEGRIEYARAKDVPLPDVLVPLASGMFLLGSVGVLLWRAPRLAAAAMVAWFVGITPTMHDFWNHDDETRQTEQVQFLKNTALLGAALMLLVRAFSEDEPDETT
ncbi:DoxX family protein [Halorarum halophilum]|uniref:DoxX family protein n=1 Tax=Halorarum halophilum TaxID=2743090 RepID=A0A7D5KH73_9EURY|nr:DoxX family protein [Halobaculum halophilum]QLG28896.1 DoxX family protein [Halobaculum halophilum]